MKNELKERYKAQIDAIKPFLQARECKTLIEDEKALLKALMLELDVGTLFVTYNYFLDEIYVFSGSSNCSDELVCSCDYCLAERFK